MATDPNQQNVFITGTDLPAWASETTQVGILNAIKTGDSNNVKLTSNMNNLMGNLISIMAGDKNAAKSYRESIRKSQEESSDIRKQLSKLTTGIQEASDNIAQGNDAAAAADAAEAKRIEQQIGQIKQLGLFDKFKFRADMAMAKTQKEQFRAMNKYLGDISFSSKELSENFPKILDKLGAPESIASGPGNDAFGGILALSGKTNVFKNAIDGAVALYSASQVPFEMMMQQVKDRFEITTELRQSGLLEDLGASFVDTTKAFSDNKMSIVEATQFVREFSKAVGVTGTNAALEFVNKTAYATDIMDRYGVNFSQVAKISGTYLDTLERTGLLEQISSAERDRGMQSFMSAVEGVSMTLKTSLEESAKMISEYLSRDDISAMLMTNSMQLSQEVITQIGAMAKMGPLGEIVAKGAIDPNRFMLTPEFQSLNNPALSGVRSIVEQMMSDLRSGRGTDELIAQYGQRMSDIISNDPLVRQLVAMDSNVATIVAGVGQLAQTSQDAINKINVPEVDQAERRRQDAERRRAAAVEGLYANSLKTLENSERLTEILNIQTYFVDRQIGVIDRMAESADIIATILSMSATANEAVMRATIATAETIVDMLPKEIQPGEYDKPQNTVSEIDDDIETERRKITNENNQRRDELQSFGEKLEQGLLERDKTWFDRLVEIQRTGKDEDGNVIDLNDTVIKQFFDTYLKQAELELANRSSRNIPYFTHSVDLLKRSIDLWSTRGMSSQGYSEREIRDIKETSGSNQQSADILNSAVNEVISDDIKRAATEFATSDDTFMESEKVLLNRFMTNLMLAGERSVDDMESIISSYETDTDFIKSVGPEFDNLIRSMRDELQKIRSTQQPTTSITNNQPTTSITNNQPTTSVKIDQLPSFVDIIQSGTQSSSDAIQTEIFDGIGEMVGDRTVQASQEQITEFIGKIQSDNQLTNAEMIEKLERTLTAIENKKGEAAIYTGASDIANLVISLKQLVNALG